jgi:predicted N-acetyltransferase YhbS
MQQTSYREVARQELGLFRRIDRAEQLTESYRLRGGSLELVPTPHFVTGWQSEELDEYVARLENLFDAGGCVVGAFLSGAIVGMASLDFRPVGGDPTMMKLDMLYVGRDQRGAGVGKALTAQLVQKARARGASALYVSATPTRATVDAYLRMGAVLLATPDAELFAREPEDIHLVLRLA